MGGKVIHTTDTKNLIKSNIRNYSMFIMLALIMLIFAPLTKWNNWNPRNFTNIFFQYSYVLILAIGMVQVIIVQGIDLSVGSVCAFVGVLSAMVYNTGVGMFVTVIAAIVMGVVIGAFQGAWIAYARIPAFIVTLAGMQLFRGLTYIVTNVNPVRLNGDSYSGLATGTLDEVLNTSKIGPYYPMALLVAVVLLAAFFISEFIGRKRKIDNDFEVSSMPVFIAKLVLISLLALGLAERFARYRGLPNIVLVLGIAVFAFHFMLNNTVLGRYIYAVGGNPRSAKLSGINSDFITFLVFGIMGGLSGLAGVVFTGYMNWALPQSGNMFEMDAIAACYIGGVSASGGIGTVIGVIVGGLVMSAINNGMSLMNMGAYYQLVVKALILLFAVFYDVSSRRKSGLG
jgi:putative multiple sugar transport system permease protein